MDTAFHRGWLVCEQRVQLRLKQLRFEALGDLTVSTGQFHYQILTFFSSMHVRLLHYKTRIYNMFCCGKLCTLVFVIVGFYSLFLKRG